MTQPRRFDPLPLGGPDGHPYSKGLMARALIAAGVPAVRAYDLAHLVEHDLRQSSASEVELGRLQELAAEVLGEEGAARAVRRLRRYADFQQLDVPVVVLVGGATGTGKSTVATEVGYRLGITRITSTDFIRQTMRAFFSEEFMPSVHHSSFEAGESLPAAEREAGDPLLVGFLDQTRNVLVGVQAAIDRALQEGWSMVLEGVHLVPGMIRPPEGILLVHVVVAITHERVHAQHFVIRDASSGGTRPLDKYLGRLADIRHIQDLILEEAAKAEVQVVENAGIEEAVGSVIELVFDRAEALQGAE
jgi:2-phosphoglycerate kinase